MPILSPTRPDPTGADGRPVVPRRSQVSLQDSPHHQGPGNTSRSISKHTSSLSMLHCVTTKCIILACLHTILLCITGNKFCYFSPSVCLRVCVRVFRHSSWTGWGTRRSHLPADHRQWPRLQPCRLHAWALCSSCSQRTKVCTQSMFMFNWLSFFDLKFL